MPEKASTGLVPTQSMSTFAARAETLATCKPCQPITSRHGETEPAILACLPFLCCNFLLYKDMTYVLRMLHAKVVSWTGDVCMDFLPQPHQLPYAALALLLSAELKICSIQCWKYGPLRLLASSP